MKKTIISVFIAIICVTVLTSLTGCGTGTDVEFVEETSEASMFVTVETTLTWSVVYHKTTKVMYVVSNGMYNYGNFTLLVNADGTPMIYGG